MNYFKNYSLLASLIVLIYFFYTSLIYQNQPETLSAPNLPLFSNHEVKKSTIIIESFGRTGCPYCTLLKENLYRDLFHPNEWLEKFNLPENLKGAVPATIVNGTYLLLGYNEESTSFYLNILDQISNGETIEENPDQYLFLIKD